MLKTGLARDIVGLAGGLIVAIGVGMIHLPAGVIVLGAELLAGAVLTARAR